MFWLGTQRARLNMNEKRWKWDIHVGIKSTRRPQLWYISARWFSDFRATFFHIILLEHIWLVGVARNTSRTAGFQSEWTVTAIVALCYTWQYRPIGAAPPHFNSSPWCLLNYWSILLEQTAITIYAPLHLAVCTPTISKLSSNALVPVTWIQPCV